MLDMRNHMGIQEFLIQKTTRASLTRIVFQEPWTNLQSYPKRRSFITNPFLLFCAMSDCFLQKYEKVLRHLIKRANSPQLKLCYR